MTRFTEAPRKRSEGLTFVGRTKTCKLAPVFAVSVGPAEGGMLSQNLVLEMDPIAGRMITPIWAELISVFVPVQACDAIKDPGAAYAGMTEVIREKLLSNAALFPLETVGEISKRCNVRGSRQAGVEKVSEIVRLAHNAAVNFLRKRIYHAAAEVLHSNTAVTPALLSSTVLQRMNAVLDPDDRINGSVNLELPTLNLPVHNLWSDASAWNTGSGKYEIVPDGGLLSPVTKDTKNLVLARDGTTANVIEPYAVLNGFTQGLSLQDFYNAEKQDELTRAMRKIVDDNPQFGEEMVLRWAHGMSVDAGHVPFVIAERKIMIGRQMVQATDSAGVAAETMRSDLSDTIGFSAMVPRTELGGVVVTFLQVKPDETLARQPHPVFSKPWGAINHVAEELLLDPEPVVMRDLDSSIAAGSETTVAFYTGHNELLRNYVAYGLSPALDPATIENKTAVWVYELPLSLTPTNVLYPETVVQYPFANQSAEVVTYTVTSALSFNTPRQFGPTPVETLAIIDGEDIFNEVP